MNITEDRRVDARGLRCPMQVMAATKVMCRPQPGQVRTVLATGRGAPVPALAEANDEEPPASGEGDGVFHFHVRKSGAE